MTDIPKIVPVSLGTALKTASQAHVSVKNLIAEHARIATEHRQAAHDRLAAENMLTDGTGQ